MIRIEITAEARVRTLTSKRTGEIIQLHEQAGFAHLPGAKYPVPIVVTVPKGESAKPLGLYALSPESFWVNRYGQLQITPRLAPVAAAAASPAARAA